MGDDGSVGSVASGRACVRELSIFCQSSLFNVVVEGMLVGVGSLLAFASSGTVLADFSTASAGSPVPVFVDVDGNDSFASFAASSLCATILLGVAPVVEFIIFRFWYYPVTDLIVALLKMVSLANFPAYGSVGCNRSKHFQKVEPSLDLLKSHLIINLCNRDTFNVDGALVCFSCDPFTLAV